MNQYVCRSCMRENPPLTYKIFDESCNLLEDLQQCLPASVKYEYNDGLPQIICEKCWWQVQQVKEFRQQILLADQELQNRYADYKNKAVEEVLGLIEKLRQEDNDVNNARQDTLFFDINEKSQDLNDFAILGTSDVTGDFDLQNYSHDSGIFEEEFSSQNIFNFENCLEKDTKGENSSLLSVHAKPSENDIPIRRKSCKVPFSCDHCDKKFTRNFQLKLHLISVHQIGNGLQYTCQMCNKTFASNHSLSYHQKSVHYQEKPYFCSHCDRQFVLKSQLVSHMRIHTGEVKPRILECQVCGKKWPTKSDLRTHMRSHDPNMERPFKCDRCEKSFFTRGHLTSHQLVHTGEKPFVCEFCHRSYQSVGNLNNHMARRHIVEMCNKEQKSPAGYQLNYNIKQDQMISMEA